MEHEGDGDINCRWCCWNDLQRFRKKNWRNWKSEKESRPSKPHPFKDWKDTKMKLVRSEIMSNQNLIIRSGIEKSRLWCERDETVNHIISEYSKLAKKEQTWLGGGGKVDLLGIARESKISPVWQKFFSQIKIYGRK